MPIALVALLSICLSVAAQFALKAGMSSEHVRSIIGLPEQSFFTWMQVIVTPLVLMGFILYGFGAVVWLKVLSTWDVSKAYPLVGFGFVLTTAIAWFVGENVSVQRLVGVLMVVVGVSLVGRS